jgi:hypothetical protein
MLAAIRLKESEAEKIAVFDGVPRPRLGETLQGWFALLAALFQARQPGVVLLMHSEQTEYVLMEDLRLLVQPSFHSVDAFFKTPRRQFEPAIETVYVAPIQQYSKQGNQRRHGYCCP